MQLWPRSLSARIVVGFFVVLAAVVTMTVVAVLNMSQLSSDIRIIRKGSLELALNTKELEAKQTNLVRYLNTEFEEEVSQKRARRRVERLKEERDSTIQQTLQIIEGFDELPRRSSFLESTALRFQQLRSEMASLDPSYQQVLIFPPLLALEATNSIRKELREKLNRSRTHLRKIRQAEETSVKHLTALEQNQRKAVTHIMKLLERNANYVRTITMICAATATILTLLATFWGIWSLRPLRQLQAHAREVAGGHYSSNIPEKGPSEVSSLASEFNQMRTAIRQRETQLIRSERLVAVGKMAAMITHEVRNPLAAIALNTELISDELTQLPEAARTESTALLKTISKEVDRLTAITDEYLQFSRLPKTRKRPEDLHELIKSVLSLHEEVLRSASIEVQLELADDVGTVPLDEAQIRQVFVNLIRNAKEAMPNGGHLRISTENTNDDIFIIIEDSGSGFDPAVLEHIFEPFFSTKKGGTGLGLAVTHQMIREHGGEMEAENSPNGGALFSIRLPIS